MQVDVFTNEAYAGNPAAVCLLEAPRPDAWMSRVAKEMNCANTAFAEPNVDGGYRLRWFTAGGVEVALCGHATLATAHVLYEQGRLDRKTAARFHTQSGLLTAEWRDDSIELDFPLEVAEPVTVPDALRAGLRAPIRWLGRNRFDYVVELESETAVRELKPDLSAPRDLGGAWRCGYGARRWSSRLSRLGFVLTLSPSQSDARDQRVTATAPWKSVAGVRPRTR
jgi:predicted PhzF superfamily epimerase YddE/YHI9